MPDSRMLNEAFQIGKAVDFFFNKLLLRGRQLIDQAQDIVVSVTFKPVEGKILGIFDRIIDLFVSSKSGYPRLVDDLFDEIRRMQLEVFEGKSGVYGHGPFEPLTLDYLAEKMDIIAENAYLDGKPLNRNTYSEKYPFPPIMVLSGGVLASLVDKNDPKHIESVESTSRFFGSIVNLTMKFGTSSYRAYQHAYRGIIQRKTGQLVKRHVLVDPEKQATKEALDKIAMNWLSNINELIEKKIPK